MFLAVANLFHSLVVIGAGISGAACGGTTSISSGGKPDEAAGSENGGSQSGGTGGQPMVVGLGGAGSSAGGNLAIGGFRPMDPPPTTGGPLPDAGTLAQWGCSNL